MAFLDRIRFKVVNKQIVGYKSNKKEVTVSKDILSIGENAFENTAIESIHINEGVTSLENRCFANMPHLKEITIPSSVKSWGVNIFYSDYELETVNMASGLDIVSFGLFNRCINLHSIILPQSIEEISDRAFYKCEKLSELDMPLNLKKIGVEAFAYSAIRHINLKSTMVKKIPQKAFDYCRELESIRFSHFLSIVDNEAFKDCKKLRYVETNPCLTKIGFGSFMGTGIKSIDLPDSLQALGGYSFYDCSNLMEIKIPSKITQINKGTFMNCKSLKRVILSDELVRIDEGAFKNCFSLQEIILKKNVEFVSKEAFANCVDLKTLVIENDDLIIEKNAFINCSSLKKIVYKGKNIDVSNLIIEDLSKSLLEELYANSEKLKAFKGPISIKVINELKEINLFDEFYNNAHYREYRRLYDMVFFVENHNFSAKDDFFLFCYTMGVFNKATSQKSSELIRSMIDEGLIDMNNISFLVKGLTFKPVDYSMVETITDKSSSFLEDIIIHSDMQIGFMGKCLEEYNMVQHTNTTNSGDHRTLKPTLKKFINYFDEDKFYNVQTKADSELAKEIGRFYDDQSTFNKAKLVMLAFKTSGLENSLISEERRKEKCELINMTKARYLSLKESTLDIFNQLHYEFLKKDDPRNLTVAKECDACCAHIEGSGDSICIASVLDPHTQTLVISNPFGEVLSKATFSVNEEKRSIIINSVQISRHLVRGRENVVVNKYLDAFKEFIKDYKVNKGNIQKVYLGVNKSSLVEYFPNMGEDEVCESVNYSKYGISRKYSGDWKNKQRCIYNEIKSK